jgi:hypothetical protein
LETPEVLDRKGLPGDWLPRMTAKRGKLASEEGYGERRRDGSTESNWQGRHTWRNSGFVQLREVERASGSGSVGYRV